MMPIELEIALKMGSSIAIWLEIVENKPYVTWAKNKALLLD